MILKGITIALFVLIVSLTPLISCISVLHNKNLTSTPFIIFGDSLLDAGNNNYMNSTTTPMTANFWPYGITHFNFPTGRFSNGRLLPDFIAELANLPLISPYLQPGKRRSFHGVNFASAGSSALIDIHQSSAIDIHSQLKNYKKMKKRLTHKLGDVETTRRLKKAVYLFSVGINDYMNLLFTNSTTLLTTYTKSEFVSMVIGNISSIVNEIYNKGGRKFVFFNLPPANCFPVVRILDPKTNGYRIEEVSSYMTQHNKELLHVLKDLEKKLVGSKFSIFDLYTSTHQRINHPSKYGYKYGKTSCCGRGKFRGVQSCGGGNFELCSNVDDHLFWDSYHFTEKVYMQIADEMWNGINYVHHSLGSYSYTIKDLFYLT